MKLVQDSSQTKAASALLGAGFPTTGDTGSNGKKLAFAEDLRQQISEAVAGSRTRQHSANPQATDSLPSSTDVTVTSRTPSLKPIPSKTDDLIDDQLAEGVAAGGMFLPLSDQSLPSDQLVSDAASAYSGTLPSEFGASVLAFDVVPSGATVAEALQLHVDTQPGGFAPQLLGDAWQSLPVKPASTGLSGWTTTTDAAASAVTAFLPINPAMVENAALQTSEFTDSAVLPAVFDVQQLAAGDDSVQPLVRVDAAVLDAALPVTESSAPRAEINTALAATNLTPDYDLALPDVMPSSPFKTLSDTLNESAPQTSGLPLTGLPEQSTEPLNALRSTHAAPLLNDVQVSAVDDTSTENMQTQNVTAALTVNTSGSLLQQQVDTAEQRAVADIELQTKGLEPASSSSTRSAFVNNLLANLLGTNAEMALPPGNTTVPQSAVTSMEAMFGLSSGLIPTKSVVSDQQLLASVGASANESASSLQGASLYHADQRLQQAAEARLAHLQGIQQSNPSVENATSRMTGTGLSGLDVTFGQPGWVERVGRQMLLQSAQGNSSAQIQLDPPELGSLTIRIQLVEQTATVNFVSPHAMVRDALEQQAQRLQEMFNEQGMNLRDVSVSDQSTNARQQSDHQSGGRHGSPAHGADSNQHELTSSVSKAVSLIDYYA
ncbi:hypothetical protein E3V39_09000 [Gammaproteobacteria bacterium LSUCC0112]|nr:hypothetical protein E3V39_09000 [Gammaproteobacteria bacterium LSUCC0112]